MDPNANLAEQREILGRMLHPESEHMDLGDCLRLAELAQAMDEWLSRQGFLPDDWSKGRFEWLCECGWHNSPESSHCERCDRRREVCDVCKKGE